jgi:hypothetical protein
MTNSITRERSCSNLLVCRPLTYHLSAANQVNIFLTRDCHSDWPNLLLLKCIVSWILNILSNFVTEEYHDVLFIECSFLLHKKASCNKGNSVLPLFDHTIKPILLYGSEVWGIFNVTSVKLSRTDDIHLNDCYKKFQGETLHLKFYVCTIVIANAIYSINIVYTNNIIMQWISSKFRKRSMVNAFPVQA